MYESSFLYLQQRHACCCSLLLCLAICNSFKAAIALSKESSSRPAAQGEEENTKKVKREINPD